MNAAGKSVKGMVRPNNEDSYYISKEKDRFKNLYIVADGMGGHNAGEIASRKAVEYFVEHINREDSDCLPCDAADCLVEALKSCNGELYKMSCSKEELKGMGTTFTCCLICGGKLIVLHVGDSRAYIFSKKGYRQITADHSYVMEMVRMKRMTMEEALNHPQKNIITKSLGIEGDIQADLFVEELKEGDYVLLCSDGLTNMVSDDRIAGIIAENSGIEESVEALVDEANRNGGKDNISVVLIRYEVEA